MMAEQSGLMGKLRGKDLNLRPLGYEADQASFLTL